MKVITKAKTATPKGAKIARTIKTGKSPAKKTSSKKLNRAPLGPKHGMIAFKPFMQ